MAEILGPFEIGDWAEGNSYRVRIEASGIVGDATWSFVDENNIPPFSYISADPYDSNAAILLFDAFVEYGLGPQIVEFNIQLEDDNGVSQPATFSARFLPFVVTTQYPEAATTGEDYSGKIITNYDDYPEFNQIFTLIEAPVGVSLSSDGVVSISGDTLTELYGDFKLVIELIFVVNADGGVPVWPEDIQDRAYVDIQQGGS